MVMNTLCYLLEKEHYSVHSVLLLQFEKVLFKPVVSAVEEVSLKHHICLYVVSIASVLTRVILWLG